MSRRLTKVLVPVGMLLVAAAVTVAVLQPWSSVAESPDEEKAPVTVEAELTTLTSDLRLNGTLSYGASVALPGRAGTITRLPAAGEQIGVGQAIYEVDGKPVIAMRGTVRSGATWASARRRGRMSGSWNRLSPISASART